MSEGIPRLRSHCLKTVNPHFQDVWDGKKTFELRKNDREFRIGDVIALEEYDPQAKKKYTGRVILVEVTSILDSTDARKLTREGDFVPVPDKWVVMSIKVLTKRAPDVVTPDRKLVFEALARLNDAMSAFIKEVCE